MMLLCAVLARFRDAGAGFVVATGDAGDGGRYEESDAVDAADEMSVAILPRPLMAAGGRAKLPSSWPAFTLLLPVMSVEGAGVGGKLGRGMMERWPAFALIGLAAITRLAV
jgi:hypothetical protein